MDGSWAAPPTGCRRNKIIPLDGIETLLLYSSFQTPFFVCRNKIIPLDGIETFKAAKTPYKDYKNA